LIAKGDYPSELNIPLPFSLISNDVTNNQLVIMPAYWFMYNLYALARNSGKYIDRDKRNEKIQHIEYDYLAPDSVNEIFDALNMLCRFTAMANGAKGNEHELIAAGKALLEDDSIDINTLEIRAYGFEANARPAKLLKVREAYRIYKQLIVYYGTLQLVNFITVNQSTSFNQLIQSLPQQATRGKWKNIGGQLFAEDALNNFLHDIEKETIKGWDDIHAFYTESGNNYATQKLHHAWASLLELSGLSAATFTAAYLKTLLDETISIKEWMYQNIYTSRAKDYQSAFRQMVYDNEEEMEEVIGKLDDNVFINQQKEELDNLKATVDRISKQLAV
jgi:hypothetical protein